jgi:hypothetical protein
MKLRPQFQLRLRDADQFDQVHREAKRSGVSLNEWILMAIESPRRQDATPAENARPGVEQPAPKIFAPKRQENNWGTPGKRARPAKNAAVPDAHHMERHGPAVEAAIDAKKSTHDQSTCRNRYCLVCAAIKEK